MPDDRKPAAFKKFDELGVDHVRLICQSPPPEGAGFERKMNYSWAQEWLAKHEKDARLAADADRDEAKRTARSAKNAAWAAAIAAIIAAIAAIVSGVIAYSSLPS